MPASSLVVDLLSAIRDQQDRDRVVEVIRQYQGLRVTVGNPDQAERKARILESIETMRRAECSDSEIAASLVERMGISRSSAWRAVSESAGH